MEIGKNLRDAIAVIVVCTAITVVKFNNTQAIEREVITLEKNSLGNMDTVKIEIVTPQ